MGKQKEYNEFVRQIVLEELAEELELEAKKKKPCKPSKGKRFAKRVDGKCRSFGQKGQAKGGGDRIRPGTKKGDAYCARSLKIKKCKNPPCANALSRKKWKCRGAKSMKEQNQQRNFVSESYNIKGTGINYVGLMLDNPDSLVQQLSAQGVSIPDEWQGVERNKNLPHHMTLVHGPSIRYPAQYLNQKDEVVVTGYAINDKVLAVTVKTNLPNKQNIPHITIAVSPTGKPNDSNSLLASVKPKALKPFSVSGTIKEA